MRRGSGTVRIFGSAGETLHDAGRLNSLMGHWETQGRSRRCGCRTGVVRDQRWVARFRVTDACHT